MSSHQQYPTKRMDHLKPDTQKHEYYSIMLILDSDDEPIYNYSRYIWRQYMNTNPTILSIFIKYRDDIEEDFVYNKNENTLYIKGIEKYECKSIYLKTIKAFEYCHTHFIYKYIVRTNISSFWIFDNLIEYLKERQHGQYILGLLVNNIKNAPNPFISGTGIIIPNTLIPLILNHREPTYIMDDVEISEFYRNQHIRIFPARRKLHSFISKFEYSNKNEIDNHFDKIQNTKIVYFRVKNNNNRLENDTYCLNKLLNIYYNKNIPTKITNIKNKEIVKIFISPKCLSWSRYLCDKITEKFQNKLIIYSLNQINNVDIIITHIKQKQEYHNEKSLNIIISGESYTTNYKYDISISTIKEFNSSYTIYLPFLYMSLKEHKKSIIPKDYIKNKTKFCAYMYSADHDHRTYYFNLLSKYMVVDGLGKSCNNVSLKQHSDRYVYDNDVNYLDEAVEIYSHYKFVLSLENKFKKNYITEKIINPLIAGSISIYWGCDSVFEYINKDRVIYIPDYTDSELLEKIKQLNENEELYNSIIEKPIYVNGKNDKMIFKEYQNNINKILHLNK